MDAELSKAACLGDVEFLKKAVASRPNEYFLTQLKDSDPAKQNGNILHLAVCEGKDVFFREALQILPAQVKEVLLSQPNDQLRNPLHLLCACDKKNYSEKAAMTTVQLILDFYRSMKIMNSQHYSTVNKPWLALDKGNCTPLHLALKQTECWNDEFAVDMLSMDLDLLCTIVDDQKYSLLYLAVARRFDHFTQMILMSSCPYIFTGFRGFTPLTMLPLVSEGVIELLLEKNQELVDAVDDNGGNMLHQWIIHRFRKFPVNTLSKFQDVRTKVFRDLIHSKNKNGRNPFHIGASATKDSSDSNKLFKGLIEGYVDYQKETNGGVLPMSPDIIHPWKAKDNSGNTPVHEAIRCHNEEIAVHLLTLDSSLWLIQDSQGLTPLYLAAATGCTGVLDHYLHHQPSAVLFRNDDDTVLHWLNGFSEKQYEKYLKKKCFAELKNITDSEGATPLHLALRRKDILLAKVLLSDNEVQRSIKDNSDTAAMDLLAKLCDDNEDWANMWKEISPKLKTKYVKLETNLGEMRNTLTVVAALLATITFAAGFTLPGGLNEKTGDAILAKKVVFLVFLLADAYALCSSMLVLFCLIWSMVSDGQMQYILVDRSVLILMQSLYGTMVAFSTAIFCVISRSSLWAGITIIVMCSFIGISINRTILYKVLAKLPKANKDPIQFLEEGRPASAYGNDDSQTALRNSLSTKKILDQEDQVLLLEESKQENQENTKGEPNKVIDYREEIQRSSFGNDNLSTNLLHNSSFSVRVKEDLKDTIPLL